MIKGLGGFVQSANAKEYISVADSLRNFFYGIISLIDH